LPSMRSERSATCSIARWIICSALPGRRTGALIIVTAARSRPQHRWPLINTADLRIGLPRAAWSGVDAAHNIHL